MEDYNKLLNRFDNALIEKELLNDEIKELKEEISKLHEMNWKLSKLLNKEIKEDNSELFKYVDELKNNINLTNKGGE